MIPSNYVNLSGIVKNRNHGVASQRDNSRHIINNYSGHNYPLDKEIFFNILKSYGIEKMLQKFWVLKLIQAIGCFTTHSDGIIPKIEKENYLMK